MLHLKCKSLITGNYNKDKSVVILDADDIRETIFNFVYEEITGNKINFTKNQTTLDNNQINYLSKEYYELLIKPLQKYVNFGNMLSDLKVDDLTKDKDHNGRRPKVKLEYDDVDTKKKKLFIINQGIENNREFRNVFGDYNNVEDEICKNGSSPYCEYNILASR